MTIAASFTPKPAILSFAITHELLTMRLFLDSLTNNNFRMKHCRIAVYVNAIHTIVNDTNCCWVLVIPEMVVDSYALVKDRLGQ